jgi:hypothetical protein
MFLLAAWNNGDFSEVKKHVAPVCAIQVNGLDYDPESDVDGPILARQSIEYWRAIAPGIKMELISEIKEKDHIAIEWLLTDTHTGERVDLPASGNVLDLRGLVFLTLEKDNDVEVVTAFDALALAVQTGAIEPADWWAGCMAS